MKAPVTFEPHSSKFAMTAPVTAEPQSPDADMQDARRWRIHFVMPSQYTLDTIPKPGNPLVQLREVPARHYAVNRYSGFNTLSRVQLKTDELLQWAGDQVADGHRHPATGPLQPALDANHVPAQRDPAGSRRALSEACITVF